MVLDGLGMDQQQRKMITDDVQIIINSAASINFDDPIREAL